MHNLDKLKDIIQLGPPALLRYQWLPLVVQSVYVYSLPDSFDIDLIICFQAGGSSALLMDLAANEKSVHADFFNGKNKLRLEAQLSIT